MENAWVAAKHDSRDPKMLNLFINQFIFIFISRLLCFAATAKKNETLPNTRNYTVPQAYAINIYF